MTVDRRTIETSQLQVRAEAEAEAETVKLVGYAAVYDSPTVLSSTQTLVVREVVRPGAFDAALASEQDVRALIDHDSSLILGRTRAGTLKLLSDGVGLYFECTLPSTQVARDLAENIRVGNVTQCSFAFKVRSGGERTTVTTLDGVTYRDAEITDVDFYDVSVVTYPAYQATSVSLRAQRFADQARREWLGARRSRLRLLAIAAKSSRLAPRNRHESE